MDPTHNKQQFADASEYKKLKIALADYLDQYIKDIKEELKEDNLMNLWKEYGYLDDDSDIPSNENRYLRKRFFKIPITIQCNLCLQWRMIPSVSSNMDKNFQDWCCDNILGLKYANI